ncbi:heterokaryon incompatibility protein-domain-containing protein [Hypoxylon sp. NC1633]|nr:heterokaryon incompatibility protein-domain-containing protein [Hypoxylon sp. NC1633]
MAGGNNKQEGIAKGTIESEQREPSSATPTTGIDTSASKDAFVPSVFSHLASRILRDWQRFGQHVNDMPYFTTPLDNEGHIRLLTIKPGADDDPVECDLSEEHIDNLPPFEALSYTWGDPDQRTPVYVAGEPFRVTANLATALRYLRYPDRPRSIWVDALCINQRNAHEVNVQIQYMTNIYGNATGILAWLGPDDGSAGLAFDVIRIISDTISQDQVGHLTALFCRPYWSRLWVVQELVLARDVQFVCGQQYLPWLAVDRLFRRTPSGGKMPFDILPLHLRNIVYRLRHIWHAREIRNASNHLTFSQLLNKYNPCRCSEPKDYVYSLLGLAPSSTPIHRLVKPDYTSRTSTEDVFRDATAAAILEDQNLNVLCLVRRHSDHNLDNIPRPLPIEASWVGDWSCVRVIRPLIEPDNAEQLFAAYKSGSFSKEENLALKDIGVLKIRGAVFDKLDVVRKEVNPLNEGWEEDVKAWEPSGLGSYRYPSGEDAVDAFWRTLIQDDSFAPFHKVHERITPQQIDDYRDLYFRWRDGIARERSDPEDDGRSFAQCILWSPNLSTLAGWTFAVTNHGYFARVQPDTEQGDIVALLQGSVVLVVLRPVDFTDSRLYEGGVKVGAWRFIGTAYVHGIMDGEAMSSELLSAEQDFYIV